MNRASEKGNHGVKNRLVLVAKKLGNVTFEEVEKMVVYKNIRNDIAHKSKWDSARIGQNMIQLLNV